MYDRRMYDSVEVAGFVLAGGKSTRMGADKAFLEFASQSLLKRAVALVSEVTQEVGIVGSQEKFAGHAPAVEDIFRDCGPLGGIHAALRGSRAELNLMLAVDMPFMTARFLSYLVAEAGAASEAWAVMPRSGGRFQPLCAVYRREFAVAAEKALRAGRYKIGLLLEDVPVRVIEEDELALGGFSANLFDNLNTPEELERARRAAPGGVR
jgi:molybdopterin-guanine dinucleotide biosynthesis protein A